MSSKQALVKVGISVGDFNGIGPEIILKALSDKSIAEFYTPIVFGSGKLFTFQKNIFKLQTNFHYINSAAEAVEGKINLVNISKESSNVTFGAPTSESTKFAIDSLEAATSALEAKDIDVLVTAPINKDEMIKEGFSHPGHTGYLEERFKKKGLMFLVSEDLKVAVLTHHIPLRQVPEQITKEQLKTTIKQLNQTLIEDFQIPRPKIAVLGLNPHSGDGGTIGTEELEVIQPAIKEVADNGILAFGPFPADSFFQPSNHSKYDAVLAMYHDQGLTPFKTLAYENGVNYSAGLPIVRTSPDHGVAYDIAGKDLADATSMNEAIFTAIKIYNNRKEYNNLREHRLLPRKTNGREGIDEDLPRN